jgi:hypothetical protein
LEPFTAKGTWWVPGEKRNRNATGTVTYSPQTGGSLEVYGKRLDGDSVYVPVLFGDTEHGPATLLGCTFERATTHESSEKSAQIFSSEIIVQGAHVRRNSLFRQATVRVTYLDEWARVGSIQPLGELRTGRKNVGPGFYYQRAPGFRATLTDGATITLGTGQEVGYGVNEATLVIVHQFGVLASRPKPLDGFLDEYVRPLIDLLTLLVDQPSSLLSLKVAKHSGSTLIENCDVGIRTNIDPAAGISLPLAMQIIRSDEFTFADQIPKWFDLAAQLGGIHGLVFGLRYASEISVENRYLNATTAAEALHRATFESKRAGIDLKNQATKDWLAQYPENERNLIKTRLNQYINDPSLADRLTELVSKAGVAFSDIVPYSPGWVKLVKDVRNDLTHQEGVPKVRVSSRQMYVLAESVALLVTICFLVDLGFTPEDLKDRLLRPLRIRVLKSEIRAVLPSSAE